MDVVQCWKVSYWNMGFYSCIYGIGVYRNNEKIFIFLPMMFLLTFDRRIILNLLIVWHIRFGRVNLGSHMRERRGGCGDMRSYKFNRVKSF